MTNLISGKEALIALANGKEVESRKREIGSEWEDAKSLMLVKSFLDPATVMEFRLKPRTITINGIEVPAPFEPKNKDECFHLDYLEECGFSKLLFDLNNNAHHKFIQYGAWRTEDEIKQVVAALRQVFGKEMKDD